MKKNVIFICFTIFVLIIGIIIGYYLPKNQEVSFYGEVIKKENSTIHIKGIPENDINHRGEFLLTISPKTKITNNNQSISLSELPINTIIRITYSGVVLESYPAQINDVIKIEITN